LSLAGATTDTGEYRRQHHATAMINATYPAARLTSLTPPDGYG